MICAFTRFGFSGTFASRRRGMKKTKKQNRGMKKTKNDKSFAEQLRCRGRGEQGYTRVPLCRTVTSGSEKKPTRTRRRNRTRPTLAVTSRFVPATTRSRGEHARSFTAPAESHRLACPCTGSDGNILPAVVFAPPERYTMIISYTRTQCAQ